MRLLEECTGKSAKQWAAITTRDGPAGSAARREWLKTAHGFTTNYATGSRIYRQAKASPNWYLPHLDRRLNPTTVAHVDSNSAALLIDCPTDAGRLGLRLSTATVDCDRRL